MIKMKIFKQSERLVEIKRLNWSKMTVSYCY
jgi:hypothetical protein